MDGPVSWIFEVRVKPGRAEAYRALVEELVASARAEPGTLVYEFFADDGGTALAYERFADWAAALAHLTAWEERFAERVLELAEPAGFTVLGDPSGAVRAAVADAGARILRPAGGFAR